MIVSSNRLPSGYTRETGLDLAAIHPSRGAKFSPNLYAYLTRQSSPITALTARLFEDEEGQQWLGYADDTGAFIGQRLSQVLSFGAKACTFSYGDLGTLREVEDFWSRYLVDGRCAIDVAHQTSFIGSDSRWRTDGETRSCQWCNKARQRLVRRVEKRTVESWEPVRGRR